ncbi:MAG: hypothetical protein H0T92_22005 [Pyrinomonadaceae bacterium]|nr:hypothetical protein [Pyrinomonadaceae bacterium]
MQRAQRETDPDDSSDRHFMRFITAIISLLCFSWGMSAIKHAGFARLAGSYFSLGSGSLGWANVAVSSSPSDPEAYYARAMALSSDGEYAASVKELERATLLRPRGYLLWLALGRAREQAGDEQGALAAFGEAVRLAPYYAVPRWQLGNLLLRMDRRDEAFEELRRAATSDPELLPAVIEFAWKSYGRDVTAIEQAVRPQTAAARAALGRFFAKYGYTTEAARLFHAAGGAAYWDQRKLLDELFAAGRFQEGYQVWAGTGRGESGDHQTGVARITDGGFEKPSDNDEPGFGWQLARELPRARVRFDADQPRAGAHSLCIEWSGASNQFVPVATQLVLVEPKTRYRLSFTARTEDLVTAGLPIVSVIDVSRDGKELARSSPLSQGTSGWLPYTVELTTSGETKAVRIQIRRDDCGSGSCPIFGRVWFDNFSLEKFL